MAVEEKTERDDYPPIRRFQSDATTAFLRAARSGNLEKVIEYLDTNLDINTANSNGLNALHLASKDGHVEIVTELLKRGAKVDAATKKGNTALHIASLAGQSEIVNILIQYGAAVNIQSQNGFTPLYMAAQENHDQVVKLLLNNGANQSLATEDGFTPLAVAMQQGHDKVVSVLLENDSKGKVRLPALHIAAKKDDCKAADLLLQNDHKPDVTSKSGFTPLHIAAHYGNEEIARLLIKRGADVNYLAKHNISPLHVAAKWGKNNMVKILLENGATLDAKTRDGLTPLHCAARSGHEQCVTTLLENSAPISARTKNGLAPLHMASQGDHVDAARVLLYHRAPVDEVTIDYLTSLHVAAHCGHVRVAKLLLDRKADPNARALNGFTPLHIACKKNRIKVVELLLKHGASIESTTESGLTPLHVASFMGCMNIVIFLLQHEANPDVPTVRGETPLHLAARANQTDIIRILLRNGAKVDARAREQQTPLHIASRLGNVDIVMLLLQHGAAVDTTTKDMYTALHIAAKEGQEEVAAILVDNNASVKATTKNGFTPLHVAAKYGNMNVAKILLQKDSKLDAQGKNDITPLLLACHYDHPNVAQLLLEKGASPHLASQNGQTPLHIAARKNQMDIATTLLEHGAKANVESKAGFTPLHLSAQKGHYDMTNLLIEHGADPNHKAKNGLTALHLCAQEDFIRVASILVKNGANVESETETGYRPIHVAAHFGNLSMIRFLLKHNAEIDVATKQNYTPLHQAAQQGHAHIVSALIEGNANHRARTNDGLTALNIAQKLGYISVMEVLKGLSYDGVTPDNKNWEEKYKVIAPESLQETSLMSDSDDEGGSDALISEQPYRYLTADLMKSLRDDSLPIDVTRDDPLHKQISKEEQQEFVQSNNYCAAENFDSNDFSKPHYKSFLVSFLVDARGGTMKGTRHSGIRLIVPPRRATMPIRVTCRLVKPSKMANPPPLMEGESLATRVIEMGPVGVQFLGPVLIDIPHFASVRGKEREIIILRSENGETWKEHDNSADNDDTLLNTAYDPQMGASHMGRITRIITTEFPQYFAIVTRIKQEVHVIGSEGGILISSVASNVQAVFPPGALTKKIKVGLQAHVIPSDLTAKLLGNCVAVSPVITIEPRRRKFHKPISLTLPVPEAANKGMINHYGGETPTLRLLCSIAGGTSEAQWEDVTGSTPLNFMNDRVSFTTTVSARFWLMDCRNVQEVPKMATDLYRESLFVPFITNFVIYSKRMEEVEATLRILCMTDSKEGVPTLEKQEEFLEIVKSRDVETLDGKDLYIEFSGNLIPVTKSGVQLKFTFKAFRQNRLSFHVKVKDPQLDPVARMMFMREPKVAKGDPSQQPLCVLNIVLPEISLETYKDVEDSNILRQKMDALKASYRLDYGREKGDQPKRTSPTEKKFITDTLQKEQTDAVGSLLAQKVPLESLDASYIAQQELQLSPPAVEKKTYSEKRRFWEDIARSKRESFQRSDSEMSHTSQLTYHDSDSEGLSEVRERSEDEGGRHESPIDMGPTVDMSECTVAEKAHYFEEQIQKETTAARGSLKSQSSQESARIAAARLSGISMSSEDDRSLEVFEETERILEEKARLEKEIKTTGKIEVKTWEERKEGKKDERKEEKKDERKEEKKDEIMEKGERRKSKEEKGLLEKLGLKDSKDKGDLGKKDEKRKSKDEKDLFGKKEAIKEEKKDEKRKSKDEKDFFGKRQDSKEDKSERKASKGEKELSETKELKGDQEKKDSEKKESITKSKFEKVDLPETKKADKLDTKAKPTAKVELEKESKAKATKMQENVSKQQKAAESKSPITTAKTTKGKEETSPKATISKQKSKEETSPKPVPIRQRSKEESFSKSPPKKDRSKDEPLSKSPPKKDKTKDDAASKSSPKSASPKTPAKSDKGKDVSPTKKDPPKHDVPKSLIPKREKSKEEFSLKSPPKSDKHKKEIMSPPKSHDDAHKSHIPLRQKSKEEFSLKSPPKETTSPTKHVLKKDSSKEKVKSPPAEHEKKKEVKTEVKDLLKESESASTKPSSASVTVKTEEKKEEIKPEVKDELKQIPPEQAPDKVAPADAKPSTVSMPVEPEKKKVEVKPELKEIILTKDVSEKVAPAEVKPSAIPVAVEVEKRKEEVKFEIKDELKETVDLKDKPSVPRKDASKDQKYEMESMSLFEETFQEITDPKKDKQEKKSEVEKSHQFPETIKPTAITTTAGDKMTLAFQEKSEENIPTPDKKEVEDDKKQSYERSAENKKDVIKSEDKDELKDSSLKKQVVEKVAPVEVIPGIASASGGIATEELKLEMKDQLKESVHKEITDNAALFELKPDAVSEKITKDLTSATVLPESTIVQDISQTLIKDTKGIQENVSKVVESKASDAKHEIGGADKPKDISITDKGKDSALPTPKREKSIGEIPTSIIPRREKSKDEFTVKSPLKDDKAKEVVPTGPKREKSIEEIPKSIIPRREKSKEEFSIKSTPKDDKPKDHSMGPTREKSIGEIPKSILPRREKSKDEFTVKSTPADKDTSIPKRERSMSEIPKSMIPKREKSKDEFTVKSPPTDVPSSTPKREKSIGEIPKSMIPKREKSKDEFTVKSPPTDGEKDAPSTAPKREKSIGEIPKSMIPKREKSKDEFTVKSPLKDGEKDAPTPAPKREKSIGEIPKSMIPKREKSKDEFTVKSPLKDGEKDAPSTAPKREKSIGEIPKSMIPKREKSKDEFTVKSPLKDGEKDAPSTAPKREKSIGEIPKSMIPKREKSKDEFTVKSPLKDGEKDAPSIAPKREKSIGEIPKPMTPRREKSKEEFSIKSPSKDDKPKDHPMGPTREKSIGEIPKSMIPRREKSKDEFTVESPPTEVPSSTPKREKSIGEIPKSMIPKREKSKDEFTVKSPPTDVQSTTPKREKSIGEIPKSMIPKREKSKDEFTVKSPPTDVPSIAPKREKSIGEIPKSMIPKREKSKDEFTVKSPPTDVPLTALKREKSIGEIPKSIIPKREKSKDEFTVKSPPTDVQSTTPKREKSIGEIPKSMIPKREKSKDEFTVKSPPTDVPSTAPKREKSSGEIPKSMIPKREKSKDEFTVKSPPTDMPSTAPKREKSIGEIPKSMIPKREKSKDEFTVKSPPTDMPSTAPKREKSIGEIPKSMIPKREKSKDEFTVKSPPTDVPSSTPKREKSIGEIPKSMIPKREKSKDEFTVKSPPTDVPSSTPKRERSMSEIPKSMIPKREKSKDEFTVKSPLKDDKAKEVASAVPKREKSIGEIPKSLIPKREKSKEEFSLKSIPKREKSRDELPSTSIPKREKSKDEIPKTGLARREKSKEEFSAKPAPKREKSKDEIPKTGVARREKSKEEFSAKPAPKREKSKDEIPKTGLARREKSKEEFSAKPAPKREKSKDEIPKAGFARREKSKEEFSAKPAPKREKSKDEIAAKPGIKRSDSKGESSLKSTLKKTDSKEEIKFGAKRRDSKEESPKLTGKKATDFSPKGIPKREKSKEEIPKTPLFKRRDSKEESPKSISKRSLSSRDSDSGSSSMKSATPSPKLTDKLSKKDAPVKKEFETVTVTKKEKSEEVTTQEYEEHTRKQTSESQVFSGTFTGDPQEALKLFEDTSALKKADFVTSGSIVTSKVDHKATISTEKKEVKSSEIDTGEEKIIAHEEKEDIQKKETSASLLTRHSPEEKVEEKECKVKETSVSATQKTLVNLTKDLETVQASASQIGKEKEDSIKRRSVEDYDKIVTTEETLKSLKDSAVGARVKLEKDLLDETVKKDDLGKIIEKSIFQEEIVDSSKTFDVKEDLKSKMDELKKDASKSSYEFDKSTSASSISSMPPKLESPESGTTASEDSHDELADDLTRKFENIMRKSLDAEHVAKVGSSLQEEAMDIGSTRDSVSMSISEDITKDESSSFQLSSSQAKQIERDITMSPSSMSEQIEIEELDEHDANKQKAAGVNAKDILATVGDTKLGSKVTAEGKYVSEISGARVLEILEPEPESQSRQDSMDVSSIEIDECKFSSGTHDLPIKEEMLHESPAIDSLETLERDVTMSPATFSEDTNIDYSLPQDSQKKHEPDLQKITIKRRTERDSFEIDSPPLVSPRLKLKELEIKPVDWMIGDEKIEVSEPLQPFQAFDKELEEYHSSLKQQQSQEEVAQSGGKPKFEIPRIEETKSTSFDEPEGTKPGTKPKFTVIPVSEQDLEIEKELVENKLDISCQELMDTLQREYDAKTPTDDRLEEMAARSFHFMTADDDEDSFDYDKEKYEAEGQKQFDEPLKFTDMPLETKTAVNVIEGEQFMRLEDTFKPIEIPGKSKNTELLQLYDEEFEETVEFKDKPLVPRKDAFKEQKYEMESMSLFEETFQEITDPKKDKQEKKPEMEKPHQFPEPIKPTAIMATAGDKMTLAFQEKFENKIPTPDKKEDEDDKNKQSYDLEGTQPKPDKSELLLKTDTKETEFTVEKEEVQLLSYKPIDPEQAKKQEETPSVTTGSPKPPKTEFHRDSKSDLRSKGWDDHKRMPDKRDKSHSSHETSPYKMKKEDFQNVDMSSRYAITVLDQVVKKEIAEVKENLEAAKQDLIEELSENSENVIQIKDSPSEFQFMLQPESIPNELPFLYKAPSLEKVSDAENLSSSSSPIAKPRRHGQLSKDESSSESSSAEKKDKDLSKTSIVVESESDKSSQKKSEDIFESFSTSSPRAASRSGSDAEGTTKDETFSLHPPQPAPRRRQKPGRDHRRHVTSESEADISSSGESNYQSCEYESGSRPSSSDVEALQSAAHPSSNTASEYETAMMSFEHSSSKATSQDYHTAVSTLSSKGSMKSLNSLSSGQMGSIDSTSELSETLMASEPEMDKDEIDENLEMALDDDMKTSNYASEDEGGKPFELDPDVPRMMKRSSEMIFSQVITSESASDGGISSDVKQSDSSTLTSAEQQPPSTTPSEVSDLIKSPPLTTTTTTTTTTTSATKHEDITFPTDTVEPMMKQPSEAIDEPSTSSSEPADVTKGESYSFEPDSLEAKCIPMSSVEGEDAEAHGPGSGLTLQQQLSMTSSSMSGVSLETVIEKETDRGSDSDSFELVDKPDIIDDFVVIEEVGREAEEYDSEGKGIRISSQSFVSNKNYDRDVENLITEKQQQEGQKAQASSTRSTTGDLFDFESEESPPQASNDDQYSQSFSDEEQYNEGGKKWIEMQFQQNEARLYDLEYERGPLEDIKEEEVTDFEAGSSRFGSVGSQKESIGSIGSMRGSFGSTPDNYDVLTAKRYFKPTDHDNVSLSSLQEFEHLENAVALENAKRREQQHSGSQDSSSNGSLPRRYATSRSGHGDDISLSSVKDFEVLEKACKEAHMIELRAREEEDLLDHESPENRYKLESLARAKAESQGSAPGSFNPSTSGSDDYEKRIKEIDEIIRLAQANVEKIDRHDDTTEDVSQIELTDTGDKPPAAPVMVYAAGTSVPHEPAKPPTTTATTTSTTTTTTEPMNLMDTSTDSLELEGNGAQNYNVMCRSSDSLELKTTLDYPSLSSDSLNNVKDPKEELERQFSNSRRISSDSLEFPVLESQDDKSGKDKDKGSSSQS